MPIAREGLREMLLGTLLLAALAWGAAWWHWAAALPFVVLWLWLIAFFRDPPRRRTFAPGEFCAPADGTVTEITTLDRYPPLDGPALRIGIFLSLFNVHVNRMPCAGTIRSVTHKPGEFLDARHPDSGARNESNTLVIEPHAPLRGPVILRQVAGLVARRIICHARAGDRLPIAHRFGLIKFGSRTELIIPHHANVEIMVSLGDKVRGGLTLLARQSLAAGPEGPPPPSRRADRSDADAAAAAAAAARSA